MVGSTQQRSEVWLGTRAKTSGGLTKAMLVKNKRGKLVSKKKSEQASSQNNLGSWLREKGKKVDKSEMLRKKSAPPPDAPQKAAKKPKKAAAKQPAAPSKKAVKKAAPKPKAAPKAPPKPAPVKQPKKQPKIVRKQAQAAPKRKNKSKINPITQQPYEKKSGTGYVKTGDVSIDNMRQSRLRRKKAPKHVFSSGGY